MDENELYHDPDTVRFYDLENGGARPDFDFCVVMAAQARSVLDLGCGTGQLAVLLADGGRREVVGIDPAGAMLDIARERAGGVLVEWVVEDARTVRLGRRFDLIVMTGHAFQVFLTRDDGLAVLETVAAHLAPPGRFVFDTRNPARREWEEWTPEQSRMTVPDDRLGEVTVWNDVEFDEATNVATYTTFYRTEADGRTVSARAQIAFPTLEEVEDLAIDAGLRIERMLGEWDGTPWQDSAREIVVIGGLA
jgi:SAM-dependent methyltransferase